MLGTFIGRMFVSDRLPPHYGCNQIARWHADCLMREHSVESNTDPENPRAQFNQIASDLNSMILSLCFFNPEDLNPGLKPMVDDMVTEKYEK